MIHNFVANSFVWVFVADLKGTSTCVRALSSLILIWMVEGVVAVGLGGVLVVGFSKCQLNYRQFERNYFNCVNHFAAEPKCNKAAAFRAPLWVPVCVYAFGCACVCTTHLLGQYNFRFYSLHFHSKLQKEHNGNA